MGWIQEKEETTQAGSLVMLEALATTIDQPADKTEGQTVGTEDQNEANLPEVGGMIPSAIVRPAFAQNYPSDARLQKLLQAFQAGNYAYVREQVRTRNRDIETEAVARAMQDLVRRTQPDPLALWLFGGAAGLWLIITAWALLRR